MCVRASVDISIAFSLAYGGGEVPTGVSDPDDAFWCASATELLSKLGTTTEGLSGTEAGRRLHDAGRNVVAEPARHHIATKIRTFADSSAGSDPPKQYQNDDDDQNRTNEPDATVTKTVAVAAEAATEATKQENDEDDNEDESQRHGAISSQ
jgi:hypothetical protein